MNNGSGASISVAAGTRLFLASDPATIFSNASGTASPTDVNSVATTSGTGGAVWIPRPQFDQISTIDVAIDQASAVAKKTGTGTTLTWSHASSGSDRLVLVGIAWQDSLDEESLDSVTYDGAAMTLVASTPLCSVYSLVNPPTGSKTIVVTWSGSNAKGAVGASISFTGVNQTSPLEAAVTGTGHSTAPSVNTLGLPSMIFSLVGIDAGSSTVTLTAASDMSQQWNDSAGSSGALTLTQGGGSTRISSGGARTVGWTLGAARDWALIAVPIRPKVQLASISQSGGASSSGVVDARNYADLQAAADDVAPGGTLFIPNGDYVVPSGGLVIRKQMTIQGETGTNLFAYSATTNQPVIKIAPGGVVLTRVTLRDLTLQNATLPSSPVSGNYGLLCDVPTDGSKIGNLTLERVFVRYMGDDGIHLSAYATSDSYFVFVALRDCQSFVNRGRGMFASYANLLKSDGSYFVGNDLDGFRGENCELEFHSSGFENNCLTSDTGRLSATLNGQLSLKSCPMSVVSGCHVERFTTSDQPVSKRGIVIEGGSCATIQSTVFVGDSDSETSDTSQRGIFITGGSSGAVMACCILPNQFFNVKKAVEIDGGTGLAADCLVTAQRIQVGTGEMMLPTGVSDSGLVLLGNRKLGTGGFARGVLFPPHSSSGGIPTLDSSEVGYVLLDTTNKAIRIWDGLNWLTVTAT